MVSFMVFPGLAGERLRWATQVHRCFMTQTSRSPKAVCVSVPVSGLSMKATTCLAEGSYPVGSEIKDGYPEFTMAMLKKLGWDGDLTADERLRRSMAVAGDKTNWKVDLSGGIQRVAIKHGCAPFGNAKARVKVWTFPDPIPLHREPLYTSRRDLVADYPTYADRKLYRLPTLYKSIQDVDHSKRLSNHSDLWSGLVEYVGGGDEHQSEPVAWPSCSRTCSSRSTRLTPTRKATFATAIWSG